MRIGLALSGGGFRATLYHLGVVRFLRDAQLLSSVSHITSVSGGSVLAAHLVMNWERYNSSATDFDDVAQEILDFVRIDVRNRIIRRYPFAMIGSYAQRLLQQRPSRSLTRTGLLERHYRDSLYGDLCLHELPKSPELHILSTNLSEGSLTSFTRSGLLLEERMKSGQTEMRTQRGGLISLATAVAASSAFPGFFPPLELTAEDMGVPEGEFQSQFFTDGGVYDNLGVRMFRYLEHQLRTPSPGGIPSLAKSSKVTRAASDSAKSKLQQLVNVYATGHGISNTGDLTEQPTLERLEALLHQLGEAPDPKPLGVSNGSAPVPAPEDNPHSADSPHQNHPGAEVGPGFDTIIASDAGKKFEVSRPDRSATFLRTAMRSSDILMDRVWQLEKDYFAGSSDCLFLPITKIIPSEQDSEAAHPEVQLQVGRIRTDMDRFDDCEIRGLVRQGYCVARQSVKTLTALSRHAHEGPAWDAVSGEAGTAEGSVPNFPPRATSATKEARQLQRSARRRYVTSIISLRDWVSYAYFPLLMILFIGLPYFAARTWRHIHVATMLTSAIADTRQDYNSLLALMEHGPVKSFPGMPFEDCNHLDPLFAEQGLDIVSDTRITDLRNTDLTQDGDLEEPRIYAFRLVSVRKMKHATGTTALRLQSLWDMSNVVVRCSNRQLRPRLQRYRVSQDKTSGYRWQLQLDFRNVPVGYTTDVVVEALLPALPNTDVGRGKPWWEFEIDADPEVATSWLLVPPSWKNAGARLVRYLNNKPENPELIDPSHQARILDDSILHWTVVHPKAGYTYTYRWIDEA